MSEAYPLLMGVETEYGFAVLDGVGVRLDQGVATRRLMELASRILPSLPGGASDLFFPSGRLYIDRGGHPEFSTAECTNPSDLILYIEAGNRVLAELAARIAEDRNVGHVYVFRSNVDYNDSNSTWGFHESYLVRNDLDKIYAPIVPHLVSRVIYGGAGGWNPLSPGLEFVLSPRVMHLRCLSSSSSTDNRGIIHTKDEPLCDGYHRLHVLSGDTLCSEVAAWLRSSITALVVAMADAGCGPENCIQPHNPLVAMQTFVRDPGCKAKVTCTDGALRTASMIQRAYLRCAEVSLSRNRMPPWAAEVCSVWRDVLDRLDEGPPSLASSLDWSIKLQVFKEEVDRRGAIPWSALPVWTEVIKELSRSLHCAGKGELPLTTSLVLESSCPIQSTVDRLTPRLVENGLSWDGLSEFQKLRDALLAMDVQFGLLGGNGIFENLDRAGVLMSSGGSKAATGGRNWAAGVRVS